MSLAQRRTTLEGLGTLPPSPTEHAADPEAMAATVPDAQRPRRESASATDETNNNNNNNITATSIPVEDGKDVWQALSYDPFAIAGPPQLLHYESFPPELDEHVAAYEVSGVRRIGQVVFAVVACVLASGIVCGFAALKPILIAEGVYSSLCPDDWPTSPSPFSSTPQIPCPAQDTRLNLFFIAASITLNVSTILAGYVLDHHGRRTCYLLAALILFTGASILALAFHLAASLLPLDAFLAGNILLGLGGTFLFVSSYQLSHALPQHSGLITALITGAFDASAVVFLFYRLAYEHTRGAFKPAAFFSAFALVVPPLIVAAEFALMSGHGYNTKREYQAAIAHAQDPAEQIHDSDDDEDAYDDQDTDAQEPASSPSPAATKTRSRRAARREARLEAIETVAGDAAARLADRAAAHAVQTTSGVRGALRSSLAASPSVAAQMRTPWFTLLLLMTLAQMTRMNYFIATLRAQYRFLLGGDEAAAARVNALFDVALPAAGVVTTPFIGALLNGVPVWATLATLSSLVVVLGVLNCVPGSEGAGYATVVVFVLYRPLYYSAVSDYATKVFGFATFGRIYGTVICVSGLGQLIQPALDALTHGALHENPIPLNVAFAVSGSVIVSALTLFVYVKTRENEAAAKEEQVDVDMRQEEAEEEERRGLLANGGEYREYGGV